MKLGKIQRAVLKSVRDHDDPCATLPGFPYCDYNERWKRMTPAYDLLQRECLLLIPHNHPDMLTKNAKHHQWRLTKLGEQALATDQAPATRRRR